jgi:hypothetical protein
MARTIAVDTGDILNLGMSRTQGDQAAYRQFPSRARNQHEIPTRAIPETKQIVAVYLFLYSCP